MLFILFTFGLCIGSFFNVVIDRIPQKISILKGRSHCENCKHVLAWYDLIPLLSFFFLEGKCRYCKSTLSWQYPLVEFLTGILFVISFLLSGSVYDVQAIVQFVILISIFSTFLALSIMDSKYGILSDKLVIFSTILSLILLSFQPSLLLSHVITGMICFVVLFLLLLITKGKGIGFGDVKLSFVMGLLLGYPSIIVAFYLAFLTGGCVALILVIAKKKKLVGGTIAFGPFLLLGTYISWYFGNTLWLVLLHLLGII